MEAWTTYLFEDGIHNAEDGLHAGVDSDVIGGAAFEQKVVSFGVVAAEFDSARFLFGTQDFQPVF